MHFAIFIAALAAAAFAVPHHNKRDLVVIVETETDIVWVTDIVTVTAGIVPAYDTSATITSSTIDPTTSTSASTQAPVVYTVMSSPISTTRSAMPVFTPAPYSSATIITPTPDTTVVPPTSAATTTTSDVQPTTPAVPTTSNVQSTSAIPSSTQPASIAPATASPDSKPTSYSQLVIAHHNLHRRNHSAPDIAWDTGLANAAAKIAASCKYAHDVDTDKNIIGGYGQNIAAGVADFNISAIITELFYNGEVGWYDALYGQAQPDMTDFDSWGHFSQIVWHDTSKVGCATQHCDVLQDVANNVPPYFTVCNYQTPGNVGGEYTEVGSSLNEPTVHWNYFS